MEPRVWSTMSMRIFVLAPFDGISFRCQVGPEGDAVVPRVPMTMPDVTDCYDGG